MKKVSELITIRFSGSTELSVVKIAQTLTKPDLAKNSVKSKLLKTKILAQSGFQGVISNSFT